MFVFGKHLGGLNTNCLAYSPDARLLVSAKSGVKVWDFSTREECCELPTLGDASSVDFSPSGDIVVANGQRNAAVQLIAPLSGEIKKEYPGSCKIQCAHFSADGETLYLAGHGHDDKNSSEKVYPIVRWSLKNFKQKQPLLGHSDEVGFLAFSQNGKWLASGNCSGESIIWDLPKRTPLVVNKHRADNWRIVAFSAEDRHLAISAGNTVEIWTPRSLKRKRILRGHQGNVHGLKFTASGQVLITVSEDGFIKHWNADSGAEIFSMDWKLGPLNNLAISPDGLTAAAGSVAGEILVWDLDIC